MSILRCSLCPFDDDEEGLRVDIPTLESLKKRYMQWQVAPEQWERAWQVFCSISRVATYLSKYDVVPRLEPGLVETDRNLAELEALDECFSVENLKGLSYAEAKAQLKDRLLKWVDKAAYVPVPWHVNFRAWNLNVAYPLITDCPNPLAIDSGVQFVQGVWASNDECPTDHDSLEKCLKSSRAYFDEQKHILGAKDCALYKQEKTALFAQKWVTVYKDLAWKVLATVESKVFPWEGKAFDSTVANTFQARSLYSVTHS